MQSVYTVQELFTDKVLRIPDYQRGYAWKEQQLEDFWEDLEYLGPDKDHYTGQSFFTSKARIFLMRRASGIEFFTS